MPSDLVDPIADAIQQREGDTPGSRSRRNFNPGNLRSGPGMTGTDEGGYAIFPDVETGREALKRQIQLNIDRGLNLNEFFGGKEGVYPGFAPRADQNDPVSYAQFVADQLGIDPTEALGEAKQGEPRQGQAKTVAAQSSLSDLSDEELNSRIQELRRQIAGSQDRTTVAPPQRTQQEISDAQIMSTNRPLSREQQQRKEFLLHHREGQFLDELSGAMMAGGLAKYPAQTILGGIGSIGGSTVARAAGAPEDVQIGAGIAGGLLGGGLPALASRGLPGLGGSLGQMGKTGLMTWGGEELLRHMGVPGPIADLIVGATVGRFGGRAQQPGEQPGPVKIPRPTRSDLNDLDAMVAGGHMTPENYVSEIMGHGYSQNVAQSRLQMAMSKRQGPTMQPAQGPAALGNLPANPSALGDIRTTVPPGVTVGQEPQMNLPRQTGPTTLQQPQPQPATPQDPNQLTLNLQGVPNVQMKLPGTVDVPQPAQEPTQFRLPPEQGNLFNAPVQDPRAAAFAQQLAAARQRALPFGRPDIPGTPLGTQVATTQELPFTERIQRGNNARVIADRAERFGKPIRIVTSERLRTRLQNSLNLDFVPSSSEIREAADILRSRGRSREPTAANP